MLSERWERRLAEIIDILQKSISDNDFAIIMQDFASNANNASVGRSYGTAVGDIGSGSSFLTYKFG